MNDDDNNKQITKQPAIKTATFRFVLFMARGYDR